MKRYRIHTTAPKGADIGIRAVELVVDATTEAQAIGRASAWLMTQGCHDFMYERTTTEKKGKA